MIQYKKYNDLTEKNKNTHITPKLLYILYLLLFFMQVFVIEMLQLTKKWLNIL
jgi:hypothetical protein